MKNYIVSESDLKLIKAGQLSIEDIITPERELIFWWGGIDLKARIEGGQEEGDIDRSVAVDTSMMGDFRDHAGNYTELHLGEDIDMMFDEFVETLKKRREVEDK